MSRAKPTRPERESSPLAQEARAAKRRALLDAAARVLAMHGPEGFNVRAVASAVGASTMVVYTLFDGRDGLLDALCRDALDRLATAFEQTATRDPLARLGLLALAYRRFALTNREYYFALSATLRASALVRESAAFQLLADAVRDCIASGVIAPTDPDVVTDALWGLVHGMVSLELGGHFPSARIAEARFRSAGLAMLAGWRSGLRPLRPESFRSLRRLR